MAPQNSSRYPLAATLSRWLLVVGTSSVGLFVGNHDADAKDPVLPSPKTIAAIMVKHSKVVASPPSKEEKRLRALAAMGKARYEAQHDVDNKRQDSWLLSITQSQAEAGDLSAAFQTAEVVGDSKSKDEAFRLIAQVQARAGDLPGALKTAERIQTAGIKGTALECVAGETARASNLLGALQLADGLDKKKQQSKTSAYGHIVEGLTERGDVAAALRVAKQIESDYNKEAALSWVAVAQVQAGDLPAAMQTMQSMSSLDRRESTLSSIGEALAKRGDYQGALDLLPNIKDEADRKSYLWDIVFELEAPGNVAGVEKALAAMPPLDPDEQGKAKFMLLCTHAWAGDEAGAVKILETIKDPEDRQSAWATLAKLQALHRDPLKAVKTLEKASAFTEQPFGSTDIPDFAYAQYVTGREGADQILETLEAGEARVSGFLSFAGQLLQDTGADD